MALPFGVSRQTDGAAGHDRSAKNPISYQGNNNVALGTSFLGGSLLIIESDLISFREMSKTL